MAETLASLSRLCRRAGDPARALAAALRAEEIGREHLRLTVQGLSERQAMRYAQVRVSGLDLALDLATDHLDEGGIRSAWESLIASRAFVLDELARRQALLEVGDPPRRDYGRT